MTKRLPRYQLKEKLVLGFGINDSDYLVVDRRTGWKCPFYARWNSMLRRCFCKSLHRDHPSYVGVTCCDEWRSFSAFKAWMEAQDWKGKDLDKDLLGNGKHYSPQACCFISKSANKFLTNCYDFEVKPMKGITVVEYGRYNVQVSISGKKTAVGHYGTYPEARLAWLNAKLGAARVMIRTEELCTRAANALVSRFETAINALLASAGGVDH